MTKTASVLVCALLLAAGGVPAGEGSLAAPVSLETRWWNEHEFAWRLAEAAGLRWAIVDGISGRARAGGENVPASKPAADFEKGTGIRVELIGGVLVAHRPDEAKRKELEARLAAGEEEAVRAAWLLGHLKDARAWSALAKAAAGKDVAVALSAAHALRRLDGEENFDIHRWVVADTLYAKDSPRDAGLSQLPMGACFGDPVPAPAIESLAVSSYVPLREAAARLAAGCGAGRTVAGKLAKDPSPPVRQAAIRTLRTWEAPPVAKPRPVQKPDLARHWEAAVRDEIGTRDSAPFIAAFGTDRDIVKLIELCRTTKSDHIRGWARSSLVNYAGGADLVRFLKELADAGKPWPDRNQGTGVHQGKRGLAALFDGEALSGELGPRLGVENWELSSEFLLARFSGPSALRHLGKVFTQRGFVAPLAVGYVGGPDSVKMIAPLLASDDLCTATAAARGLGESAQLAAVAPLIKALADPNRVLRSRAALALGRIGGPDAAKALAALLKSEEEYLPRRSACAMLREIGTGEPAHAQLIAAAEKELAEFVPSFNPVNPRFGADFPTGKLVPIGNVFTVASLGETRCAVDQYSGVWLRYGGCDMCYSNEAIGYDVASGKWFVVRPNETTGLFYNETRAGRGCSRGMAFDPRSRTFFVNNSTGFPTEMYPGQGACRYDLATDRFEGNFPDSRLSGAGGGPKWYVADTRRGHVYSEWMGPTTTVIDAATAGLVDRKIEGLPRLHEYYVFEAAGYDPVSDRLLREVKQHSKRQHQPPEDFGVWLLDLAAGKARKSQSPLPEGKSSQGMQMVFDTLNRELVLLRSTGAFTYDRAGDAWRKVSGEDCHVRVFDYDPQHNVFIGLRPISQLVAFRLKNVPAGTKAFYGEEK